MISCHLDFLQGYTSTPVHFGVRIHPGRHRETGRARVGIVFGRRGPKASFTVLTGSSLSATLVLAADGELRVRPPVATRTAEAARTYGSLDAPPLLPLEGLAACGTVVLDTLLVGLRPGGRIRHFGSRRRGPTGTRTYVWTSRAMDRDSLPLPGCGARRRARRRGLVPWLCTWLVVA